VESPLFPHFVEELGLSEEERKVASDLHHRGIAVIDFPDDELDERINRVRGRLSTRFRVNFDDPNAEKNTGDLRVQDAWKFDEDVRAIAANEQVRQLLSRLYGRQAFPFQTLNFPVGTQQHLHSDSIHFSCMPERFMCGVWLAMEDVDPAAGPLTYLPGSHKWPILKNMMIGRRGWNSRLTSAQAPFEQVWEALIETSTENLETFLPRRGQAVIWAANLLHGGGLQTDKTLTRWSQVTHYYFDECIYYTPAFSDEDLGKFDLRTVPDVRTGELRGADAARPARRPLLSRLARPLRKLRSPQLPEDFDPDAYYALNPDVATAGLKAADHYLAHGKTEGRPYRY
jgi:hypothetical protein